MDPLTVDGEETRSAAGEDPMNLGFPCHPQASAFTEDDLPDDFRKPAHRPTCPVCSVRYWGRFHTFEHPLTSKVVFEWAHVRSGVTTVYPVPALTVMRCKSPFWSDTQLTPEPVGPNPFYDCGLGLFEDRRTFDTDDLARSGYQDVLHQARAHADQYSIWKKSKSLGLVVAALPVTVTGRVVAEAGEVLVARMWWQLPGHPAVLAFCPRLDRPVVMHHSYAVVPAPHELGQ